MCSSQSDSNDSRRTLFTQHHRLERLPVHGAGTVYQLGRPVSEINTGLTERCYTQTRRMLWLFCL